MITINEVKQIISKLSWENISGSDENLIDDITCIIYRNDVFDCGNTTINSRHIDIEFSFGEYYELHENSPAFQLICSLCDLQSAEEEQEFIIYQKS